MSVRGAAAFTMWMACILLATLDAPAQRLVCIDVVDGIIRGPRAWQATLAWGLRSRWQGDAGSERQRARDGCGPAALHVMLSGRHPQPTQDLLWSLCRLPAGGSTLGRLAWAARRFGTGCDVIWTADCATLQTPAIVHLTRGHFVVLLQHDGRRAWLLDPACGRVCVPLDMLRQRASGATLVLHPDPASSAATAIDDWAVTL